MTLHGDLLAQASFLARREPTRPKQSSLRRAISAAYYALFHLLVFEASRLFVKDDRLWKRLSRVYSHKNMNLISKRFSKGEWPKAFDPLKSLFMVPRELRDVSQAFIDLQEARHDADYNLSESFARSDALDLVKQAEKAFSDWETIRKDDIARIYLGSFLLWDEWEKSR